LCLKMEMTYEGIDKLVRRVRDIMDIRDGVIFDYFELYEIHGFRVIALPLFRRIHSALYFDSKNENAFFFVNVRNNPERQLFCLLYELGHLLIYMWYRKNEKIKSSSSSLSALTIQKAAKKFAALFLMPAPAVYSTVDQLGIKKKQWDFELLLRIKHRFGVSAEAFLYRLEELDLIDKSQVDDLRSRIHAYYKETDFGEPASSRRILNYNGRVWDLVLTAKADTKNADEVQKIETLFSKHRVVKI